MNEENCKCGMLIDDCNCDDTVIEPNKKCGCGLSLDKCMMPDCSNNTDNMRVYEDYN